MFSWLAGSPSRAQARRSSCNDCLPEVYPENCPIPPKGRTPSESEGDKLPPDRFTSRVIRKTMLRIRTFRSQERRELHRRDELDRLPSRSCLPDRQTRLAVDWLCGGSASFKGSQPYAAPRVGCDHGVYARGYSDEAMVTEKKIISYKCTRIYIRARRLFED